MGDYEEVLWFHVANGGWVEVDMFTGGSWYGGTRSFIINSGEWRIRWNYESNIDINKKTQSNFHFSVLDVRDKTVSIALGDRKTIKIVPQKHGRARELRISETLITLLKKLPKKFNLVFSAKVQTIRSNFAHQRKRIANKLNNPRLNQLHFHSIRHWRATIEYQRTKSILQVQQMLGHRNIKNTMVYTHLINFEANCYISRVTRNAKGARALVEAGFEYVATTPDGLMLFRKTK